MPRHYSPRWSTRKRGTSRQKGKRFPIKPRRNIKVASVLQTHNPKPLDGHTWQATELGLAQLNPDVHTKIKQTFGTTADYREAGYILPDGTLADFSGKTEGGSAHSRNYDHREVSRALELGDCGIEGTQAMIFVERQGALRFHASKDLSDFLVSFETTQTPTEKQWEKIKQGVRLYSSVNPNFALGYDIYAKDGTRLASEYIEKAKPSDVDKLKQTFMEHKKKEGT